MNPADFPWIFRRDDIDLLEDEIDDLYAQVAAEASTDVGSLEEEVLREQRETEEQSEAELSLKLHLRGISPLVPAPPAEGSFASEQMLTDRYGDRVRAHPMYQYARLWARRLREVAKSGYAAQGVLRKDFFRVYANANLVPIKVFTALCEGGEEDQLGLEVALEAFEMATVYVARIQESLACLRMQAPFDERLERLMDEGGRLGAILREHAEDLKRRKRFV